MHSDHSKRYTFTDQKPVVVAVGFRRIKAMLQALAPELADRASVQVLDVGFQDAVTQIQAMQAAGRVDVVVAAGSNGGFLRQQLDVPVVLVKVGGFDLMQALAQAKQQIKHEQGQAGLVAYEGIAPDVQAFQSLFEMRLHQRTYLTEAEAELAVRDLKAQGVSVIVGSGVAVDCAEHMGVRGIFLYSLDAVREALKDALEVARAARIAQAKRERLNTILAQLNDGVIAVDVDERIQTLNPAMARWLDVQADAWIGRCLSEVCPALSLQSTLRLGLEELEKLERVQGKNLIVCRMPIWEQGVLTGAVLTAQDPISIQRVDRHIRSRIQAHAAAGHHELSQLVGDSAVMQQVRNLAERCAASAATVLILGESGTGKELVAQGIHAASERRAMPFVAVNCAAVTETLLESELFGYEDGAFTGARKGGKIGLFEAAHNGTIFLDEIGEMPLALQARLLRVLQEREVMRVGATEPTPVNVRVISATHRDLQQAVAQGRFRQDLYYRLNILRIQMPPLRFRAGDVPLLAQRLHQGICQRLRVSQAHTAALLDAMLAQASVQPYAWPGNVRELENLIERLIAYAPNGTLSDADVAALLQVAAPELSSSGATSTSPPGLKVHSAQQERAEIERVLIACGGDRSMAAAKLGLSRSTLWRKLKA